MIYNFIKNAIYALDVDSSKHGSSLLNATTLHKLVCLLVGREIQTSSKAASHCYPIKLTLTVEYSIIFQRVDVKKAIQKVCQKWFWLFLTPPSLSNYSHRIYMGRPNLLPSKHDVLFEWPVRTVNQQLGRINGWFSKLIISTHLINNK